MQPQDQLVQTIAIVGGGFSGTARAVHLLRQRWDLPLRVVLIERSAEVGRGIAYARSDCPVLLNVPASRMSATMSDPDEFLRFARRRNAGVAADEFLPRTQYGDYLQDLLRTAAAKAPSCVRLEQLRAEVIDVQAARSEQPLGLLLADGTRLTADVAVLAAGVPVSQSALVIPSDALPGDEIPSAAAARTGPPGVRTSGSGPQCKTVILVVGTGLTMVDVVCTTAERNPDATFHGISRHGLLPRNQTAFPADALQDDGGLLAMSAGSIARLVSAARRLARESARRGGDWRTGCQDRGEWQSRLPGRAFIQCELHRGAYHPAP